MRIAEEVHQALADGTGVVALESTIISHGLPTESAEEIARQIEAAVRESGAVPATIALIDGEPCIGLDDQQLHRIATDETVVKASNRDLGIVMAKKACGATTVAATSWLADRAGIRVFATGGLGGVHRGAETSFDESADLPALAHIPVTVVCAGVKSILDVPATLERLETLSVAVAGYRTDRFPGFYIQDSGYAVPWQLDTPEEVAAAMRGRDDMALRQALVLANPILDGLEMDRDLHDQVLTTGLEALEAEGVRGKDVTPFLLAWFHERSGGVSLTANVDLVLNNARLAGQVAVAHARG